MGMAAPQARLLQLTSRNNDIGYEMSRISNQKVSLSRDMERVSRDYQNALSAKTLKWSNNGGGSYVDLSYNNLMKPSGLNLGKSYAVTDSTGRVVVDSQYLKYAEMISANGAPNGDWESVRNKVLAGLLGKNTSDIESYMYYDTQVAANKGMFETLNTDKATEPKKEGNIKDYLDFIGYDTGDYTGEDVENDVIAGTTDTIKTLLNGLTELLELDAFTETLSEEDLAKVEENINEIVEKYTKLLDGSEESNEKLARENGVVSYDSNGATTPYQLDFGKLFDTIFANCMTTNEQGENVLSWIDKNSTEYQEYLTKKDTWDGGYQDTADLYNKNINMKNSILTAEEQSLLEFYDAIFSLIAQNGWTYNNQVNDKNYLNQMLQNNSYTLTTVSVSETFDKKTVQYVRTLDYSTDIASNFPNVFIVNDTDAREDALVKYENEKRIINAKETRLDTRMQNLQTEQASIKQMMQSDQKIINDNIQRIFEMFS